MATTTASALIQRMSEHIQDWKSVAVTTAIAADTNIISTNLKGYKGSSNNRFPDWWIYITDKANADVNRQISTYTETSGTVVVRGSNLSSDGANLATIELHRLSPNDKLISLNDAIRETSSKLFKYIDNMTLVTGNILPDGSFEDWSSATALTYYATTSNCALAKTSTAGQFRHGIYSAKATPDAANGYFSIKSDNYKRLLQLQGKTVDFKCWALPQTANDAYLVVYTKQADGTEQTLTSTTANPAGEFTLLELESQELNDDLVEVEIRFKVATSGQYVIFEDARLTSDDLLEYLLPTTDLEQTTINEVFIQASGNNDDWCDDLRPDIWIPVLGWSTVWDGTTRYLKLPYHYSQNKLIRIKGHIPLSTLSARTDTVEISGAPVNLLTIYANYKLFSMMATNVSSQDAGRYQQEATKFKMEYERLKNVLGTRVSGQNLNFTHTY